MNHASSFAVLVLPTFCSYSNGVSQKTFYSSSPLPLQLEGRAFTSIPAILFIVNGGGDGLQCKEENYCSAMFALFSPCEIITQNTRNFKYDGGFSFGYRLRQCSVIFDGFEFVFFCLLQTI